jgi:hypothetical protein
MTPAEGSVRPCRKARPEEGRDHGACLMYTQIPAIGAGRRRVLRAAGLAQIRWVCAPAGCSSPPSSVAAWPPVGVGELAVLLHWMRRGAVPRLLWSGDPRVRVLAVARITVSVACSALRGGRSSPRHLLCRLCGALPAQAFVPKGVQRSWSGLGRGSE